MDCSEVRTTLLGGGSLSQSDISAHVQTCDNCAALHADGWKLGRAFTAASLQSDVTATELSPLLQSTETILEEERGLRAWLRSRTTRSRLLLATLVVLVLAGSQLVFSLRADWSVYPARRMLLTCGVFALGCVAALREYLRPLTRPPMSPARRTALATVLLCAPVLIAGSPRVETDHPASLAGAAADFAPRAGACFAYGLLLSALLVWALWSLRRQDRARPSQEFLAAASAGLAASLLLQIHCPIVWPAHLLAGHASVGFAWLIGLVLLAWRGTRPVHQGHGRF